MLMAGAIVPARTANVWQTKGLNALLKVAPLYWQHREPTNAIVLLDFLQAVEEVGGCQGARRVARAIISCLGERVL